MTLLSLLRLSQQNVIDWVTLTSETYISQFWRLDVQDHDATELVPGEGSLPGLQWSTSHLLVMSSHGLSLNVCVQAR